MLPVYASESKVAASKGNATANELYYAHCMSNQSTGKIQIVSTKQEQNLHSNMLFRLSLSSTTPVCACHTHHSTMLNLTACLAVKIQNLPSWSFDWSDAQPQYSRESLTLNDFLSSEEDAQELQDRAVQHMMRILVT